MANQTKCAHNLCQCPAMEDSDYCSQACRDADDSDVIGVKCDCGHPGCE